MRALVVGAGIGGMGAAVALKQAGIDVEIVEIKPNFSVYGVGINQPANSLRALRTLGVLDQCLAAGYQFSDCSFFDQYGEHIVTVPYALGGDDVPANNALSRADLHRSLIGATERAGIATHYGTSVTTWQNAGDVVEVELTDGRHETYDLVVCFDGIKSTMRGQLFGAGHDPVYSGFSVWRLSLDRPAEVTGMQVYQALGVKAGLCPLSETSMYMFVVTPEPAGVVYAPEDFGDLLRARMSAFEGLLGKIRDDIAGPEGIVYSPISDVLLPVPWFKGRVGVLGDAAHACAPHLTQGAGMALEDGVVLAEELTGPGTVEERLRRFELRRYPRARLVQDVSRGILEAEMAVTAENYQYTFDYMRTQMPDQMRSVDQLLDAPA